MHDRARSGSLRVKILANLSSIRVVAKVPTEGFGDSQIYEACPGCNSHGTHDELSQ